MTRRNSSKDPPYAMPKRIQLGTYQPVRDILNIFKYLNDSFPPYLYTPTGGIPTLFIYLQSAKVSVSGAASL